MGEAMIWMLAAGVAVAVVVASSWILSALSRYVWRPRAITKALRAQGVDGPDYRFLIGNIGEIKRLLAESASLVLDVGCHDYTALVQPHFCKWMALYGTRPRLWPTINHYLGPRETVCTHALSSAVRTAGRTFISWQGEMPELFIGDVDMVKQVLSDRTGLFPKNPVNDYFARLLGKGLILIDGDEWKRHRKVVHPVFNAENLKVYKYK